MELFLAVLLKPFIAVPVFFLVFLVASLVHKYLPDGKLKKILFSPLPGHKAGRLD